MGRHCNGANVRWSPAALPPAQRLPRPQSCPPPYGQQQSKRAGATRHTDWAAADTQPHRQVTRRPCTVLRAKMGRMLYCKGLGLHSVSLPPLRDGSEGRDISLHARQPVRETLAHGHHFGAGVFDVREQQH